MSYGLGTAFGLAKETSYGTPVSPALWVPFVSQSMEGSAPLVTQGTIMADRSVYRNLPQPRSGAGDVTFEVDGSNQGMPLYLANGNASGGYAAAAIPGRISSAPTVSVNSGGTIPVGTYRIRVASVWQRADLAGSGEPGEFYYLPVSAELQATATSGNQTFALSFTDPTTLTPPLGFTYYGTAIYISAAGGGSNTEKFLAFVVGTDATYSHTGSATVANGASGTMVATMYQHTYTRAYTAGQNPVPGFTTTILQDNDVSEQYMGCRSNGIDFTWNNGDAPLMSKMAVMARDYREVANPTPSVPDIIKMMSWQATVAVDGTFDERIEGLQLAIANNCELLPGLSGQRRRRDVGFGTRMVTGSLSRDFADHTFWRKLRASESFGIRCTTVGGPISATAGSIPLDGSKIAYPIPYFMTAEVFGCKAEKAGATTSNAGRLVETVPFKTEVDSSTGTECRIRVYNLTSDYAA